MNSAVLFSGGKDSVMALNYAINNGDDVKYLLSIKSENEESYMFHVPNIHLTDLISQAVGIPIIEVKTSGVKEEELMDLKEGFKQLKGLGIDAIYTGALFSTYQKSRIEKLADEIGIEAISPYWHRDPKEYMELVIDSGFKVIISGVFAEGLDESWLGRLIDEDALRELEKISEKTYLHLAFEGGEAETLVIDGPIFKKRIEIIEADIDWHRDSGTYNVIDAKLVDKN
jgi:predicted ATP pyrophosphatase (TIGR00289 family)